MIGNKLQGMKVIGYLHPPKVKDNTLTQGVFFDMTEIQDALSDVCKTAFKTAFKRVICFLWHTAGGLFMLLFQEH